MDYIDRPRKSAALPNFDRSQSHRLFAASLSFSIAVAWALFPEIPLPAAAAAALWGALAVFLWPFVTCLVFVAFSYFRLHEAFPLLQPLHIPELSGIAALCAMTLHILVIRTVTPMWSRELSVFLGFFVLVSLGTLVAVVPELASTYWWNIYVKIGLMTFAIAWLTQSIADFRTINRLFVFCGLLIALVALYNRVNGIDLVGTRVTIGRELGSTIGDPNDLAFALLLPLSFACAQLVHRSGTWTTIFSAVSGVAIVAAIVATQSRGGLIGVIAVAMAIGGRVVRNKWLLWGSCCGIALMLYIAMGIGQRDDLGGTRGGLDESSFGRVYAWSAATQMAIQRPLTGVGLGNFVAAYNDYRAGFDNADHAVHSSWFAVLAEVGFPGLAIFAMLVATCFKSILKSDKILAASSSDPVLRATALSLVAGLLGLCAAGTFLTQAFTWPLYIVVALTAALAHITVRPSDKCPGGSCQSVHSPCTRFADG